jgi:pimeloyl-ACP methyl ester carboxylesterase
MRYLKVEPTSGVPTFPPLVLIHGFLAYSFSWRHNLEILARDRVVYAVDLLGAGYSDRPSPESVCYDIKDSGERIIAWMDAVGLRGADLLGTSLGGAVAMAAAIADRQQAKGIVRRLVLVDPASPYMRAGKLRIRFFNTGPGHWAVRWIVANIRKFGPLGLGRMYFDSSKITDATRDGYHVAIAIPGTAEYASAVLKRWYENMGWIRTNIGELRETPTLLLWGMHDLVVPVASSKLLHANLPKSELVLLARAGHLPYEETPEEFNRVLIEYLDGEARGSGQK